MVSGVWRTLLFALLLCGTPGVSGVPGVPSQFAFGASAPQNTARVTTLSLRVRF